ncbi:MAG: uroporphyrinogen-III synthase [Chloroflexota bacterium]|nr:uroporphyrinogen-III synthase [Chloroflexota bacterium]
MVTRTPEDNAWLRARFEALGATVVELPAVAIEPPDDPRPLETALAGLDCYDWIAFSSRNAVHAVFNRIDRRPEGIRVAAVGPATAAALREHGITPDLVPEEATGVALASAILQAGARSVLLPLGDRARPDLADGLRRGAAVKEVVAYRTVRPEADDEVLELLRRGEIDAVALASPSALDHLLAMLGRDAAILGRARLVCIGPATACAVTGAGLGPAAVGRDHTREGLFDAVRRCLTEPHP